MQASVRGAKTSHFRPNEEVNCGGRAAVKLDRAHRQRVRFGGLKFRPAPLPKTILGVIGEVGQFERSAT